MTATPSRAGVALTTDPGRGVMDLTDARQLGRSIRMAAVILGVVDVLLVVANVVHYASDDPGEPTTRFTGAGWDGDRDGSYIEITGHVQLIAAIVLLLALAIEHRSWLYAVWAATLVAIVIDDLFQVHELLGGSTLVRVLGLRPVFGFSASVLGELLVWAIAAVVLGDLALLATRFAPRQQRRVSLALFAAVAVLAVVAVGVDAVHLVVEPHVPHLVAVGLTLLETAGELAGMSLILIVVIRAFLRGHATTDPAVAEDPAPAR